MIWITWENQRRNREVSKRIGAILYEFAEIDSINNPVKKYLLGIFKTTIAIVKKNPSIVFCQNPSIVLSLFLCIVSKIFRFSVIVDAHNAGIFPLEGRSKILLRLSIIVQRIADLTIVTNPGLALQVIKNGGKPFVMPDPIPEFKTSNNLSVINHVGKFNAFFICSFSEDEPYASVFEAAKLLNNDYCIYVSGNYKKRLINPELMDRKINLLGYLSENRFINFLHSVDVTIDLTSRENCLVCGAYESVAAEKPLIVSDTEALRTYFNKGAIYTNHQPDNIASSIVYCKENYAQLKNDVQQLKYEKIESWRESAAKLKGKWLIRLMRK